MLKRVGASIVLSMALAGCILPKVMDANYHSSVDPDFTFNKNERIAVVVSKQRNPLDSKFYVKQVVQALKQKGFVNTVSYKELDSNKQSIDLTVVIDVETKVIQSEVEYDIYDDVETGKVTTECTETKNGNDKKVTCVKSKETRRKVVGTETKTVNLQKYAFNTEWIDTRTGDVVLTNSVFSYEQDCSDRGMFDFLIKEAIHRLNFSRPNNYKFSVTMAEGYTCGY